MFFSTKCYFCKKEIKNDDEIHSLYRTFEGSGRQTSLCCVDCYNNSDLAAQEGKRLMHTHKI